MLPQSLGFRKSNATIVEYVRDFGVDWRYL